MPIILTDENFEEEVQKAGKPVLVDFFAVWCAPCSVLAPVLEKLVDDFKGKFLLLKANIDDLPLVSQKFGIEQIPTVIFFNNGKAISGFIGLKSEAAIKEWLDPLLKENEKSLVDLGDDRQQRIDELTRESADYAQKNGFQLNSNKEIVERIINGLLENEKKHGEKYCPCRRITGNHEEDVKKICPCYYHKEEIKNDGKCFCGLFTK
ncbi:MAG: thioredoxin [bacterium]